MSLLQEIPCKERFTAILASIMGDEAAGTGVAGVLKLLKGIDTGGISSSLSANLDQMISANFAPDSTALTGGAVDQFQQVMTSFPNNPASLIEPLTSRLDSIKSLSPGDLLTKLLAGIDGMQNIETLIPFNTKALVSAAVGTLTQLKGEFIPGPFGELRQWSDIMRALNAEIAPLLTEGSGTLEERLIDFLRTKIPGLITTLLPAGQSPVAAISTQFDTAILADRLTTINTIKTDLIHSMNAARVEFDSGNFSNIAHFAQAQAKFQQLTAALAEITTWLRAALAQEIAAPERLADALQKQVDDFDKTGVIDLSNFKDKFTRAIQRFEEATGGPGIEAIRETIEDVYTRIDEVIGRFELSQLTGKLSDLRGQLDPVPETLDAALFETIASIRNIYTRVKESLRSAAAALGSYDENGDFHYRLQQEIEYSLDSVKTTLRETIQPMLDRFKNTIGQTLRQVQAGLNAVKNKIETVKAQLQSTLQGVNEQLQKLDAAGTMENIRQELDTMLDELGRIDFNPVVDPLVSQIDEMREGLEKVDVSSLNEITIEALKVSVEGAIDIDFPAKITNTLTGIDTLLEAPRAALKAIKGRVEGILEKFAKLEPDALLAPLDKAFVPISKHLDALKPDNLLEPLDPWYERARQELDKVLPAALLRPLIDLHTRLLGAFETISPTGLIRPLQEAIDEVKGEIQAMDITGTAGQLSEAIYRVKGKLDEISPGPLLNPLVDAFAEIMTALDQLDPGTLLQPFKEIFETIAVLLDNLNAEHVRMIGEALAGMRDLFDAFDPRRAFQVLREKVAGIRDLLEQLNIGGLIAELKRPYDAMHASFTAGGGTANASLSASVEGLDPLQNDSISQAVADIRQSRARLQNLAQATPSPALIDIYDKMKSKLESFIPAWDKTNISPDSIRRVFQLVDPLEITAVVNRLYETIKQQLQNFDPRGIREKLEKPYETLKNTIFAIDPGAIVGEVQGTIEASIQRLEVIDMRLIVDESEGLADEIQTIINDLDPHPIITHLQGQVDEVTGLLAALKPSEALNELNAPYDAAKEIAAEFDPANFKEPLQEVSKNIQKVRENIDVGVVLQPLVSRLDWLRDELEEGLSRTGTSFKGMIRAIPV